MTISPGKIVSAALSFVAVFASAASAAKNVAYIHGDVAADGTIPSGAAAPYHQMLLTVTGNLGCSQFKAMVEGEGYTISQHYDAATTLDATFLDPFDVIVFGLHQKVWTAPEQAALDTWIRAGGGILMYSDSAAGGHFGTVGIQNPVGQLAVNSILTAYGMQVTVDHGAGTRSYTSAAGELNPIVSDQPEFEGEGVSPVAVDETTGARALIPCEDAFKTGGSNFTPNRLQNITIPWTRWAVLGHRAVDEGNVIAIFDRQPMWNNGPGSNINSKDNLEVLRRIVRFLADDYEYPAQWRNVHFGPTLNPGDEATVWGWLADPDGDGLRNLAELAFNGDPLFPNGGVLFPTGVMQLNPGDSKRYLEFSYRQWCDGTGTIGVDYTARGVVYCVEYSPGMQPGTWISGPAIGEPVGSPVPNGDGTETATVRVLPANEDTPRGFARLCLVLDGTMPGAITVEAGGDRHISSAGSAYLDGQVSGPVVTSINWMKISGPGTVNFADPSAPETTATFTATGVYQLALTASNGVTQFSDTMMVEVFAPADVVMAINCGNTGSGHAGNNGFSYVADTLFTGGHTDNFPGNAVAGTNEDLLYNHARSALTSYDIPVANDDYLVLLQFAETFFTSVNKRVFDTSIEGVLVIDDLDLFATAPGKWVAYDRAFQTTVSDGVLTMSHTSTVNNALLNAIVVIRR